MHGCSHCIVRAATSRSAHVVRISVGRASCDTGPFRPTTKRAVMPSAAPCKSSSAKPVNFYGQPTAAVLRLLTDTASVCESLSLLQPSNEAPSLWLVPAALIGLPAALWLYKCIMMVALQRKMIYMGYVPPGARMEELGVDVPVPKSISCEEMQVQSSGHVMLSGILVRPIAQSSQDYGPDIVVVYLQGNAGNPLGRLPVFERLLQSSFSSDTPKSSKPAATSTIAVVAVAPRSYWKSSSSRATESGLLADYEHVLYYTCRRFPSSTIVLYGHSLGGAVAICLAARLKSAAFPVVRGLIVENPFLSIADMVRALYPQSWLPYRYLTPFILDKWDAGQAMRMANERHPGSLLECLSDNMLMLLSEKDELVPTAMGERLYTLARALPRSNTEDSKVPRRVVIRDALHEEAWKQRQWVLEMRRYMGKLCE